MEYFDKLSMSHDTKNIKHFKGRHHLHMND